MTAPQLVVTFLAAWFTLGLAAVGLWNLARWSVRRSKFGRSA